MIWFVRSTRSFVHCGINARCFCGRFNSVPGFIKKSNRTRKLLHENRSIIITTAPRTISTTRNLNADTNVEILSANIRNDANDQISEAVEHSFSLWPPNIINDVLIYIHDGIGLDWCPTLLLSTMALRLLTIPPFVMSRAFSVRTANNQPKFMRLMSALNKAKMTRNKLETAKAQMNLMENFKITNTNPMKSMLYVLPPSALFCSFYFAIKRMASAPVESLTNGGYLWFENLAIPDPYLIIPILCSTSMWLAIRFGGAEADMGPMANNADVMKFLQFLPLLSLPFISYQPAAVAVYWLGNNCLTISLMMLFKNVAVRKAFGIPDMVKHSAEDMEIISNYQKEQIRLLKGSKTVGFQERLDQHKKMLNSSKSNKKT